MGPLTTEELATELHNRMMGGASLLEAMVELCDEVGYELEWLAPYVVGPLKEQLRVEGESLGLLHRDSEPVFTFE